VQKWHLNADVPIIAKLLTHKAIICLATTVNRPPISKSVKRRIYLKNCHCKKAVRLSYFSRISIPETRAKIFSVHHSVYRSTWNCIGLCVITSYTQANCLNYIYVNFLEDQFNNICISWKCLPMLSSHWLYWDICVGCQWSHLFRLVTNWEGKSLVTTNPAVIEFWNVANDKIVVLLFR
jgi:hypothetical protein